MDCKQAKGAIARIDAVFNEVKQLIETDGVRAGCDDRMSFITFSDKAKVHFQATCYTDRISYHIIYTYVMHIEYRMSYVTI